MVSLHVTTFNTREVNHSHSSTGCNVRLRYDSFVSSSRNARVTAEHSLDDGCSTKQPVLHARQFSALPPLLSHPSDVAPHNAMLCTHSL